jgi:hypothetical protein
MKTRSKGRGRSSVVIAAVAVIGGLNACNQEVEFRGASADKKNPQVVLDQEFPAARIADGSSNYRPTVGDVEESLQLREKPLVRFDLRQTERLVGVETFRQGHDGSLMNEEFSVSKVGKLDLLVVVDNSGSMQDEQANLATKLSALTKHLKTTDWQVGVITTSSCDLRNNGKPIKAGDATAETDFATAVNVGIGGSGNERGILRAYQLLSGAGTCDNKWLRADASLAMLFVSDEESYCATLDCPTGSRPAQLEDYIKNTMKVDAAKLKSYALVWDDADPNCKNANGESEGTRYIDLATRLNGISSSICEANYTTTLERISKDVSRIVTREFDLKFTPANALQLTVDGAPFMDFQITGKTIKLNTIADSALKLKISYRYDATPKFSKVTLTSALDPSTVQVFVNNKPVDPSRIQYSDSDKELHFVDMPEDNAEVKVKYRKNDTLPPDFDLASAQLPGPVMRVEVNGVAATGYRYDEVTEVLTFDEPPTDGAVIGVFATTADPAIVRYKITGAVDVSRIKEVTAVDAATNEALDVTVEGGELVFAAGDVTEGRSVLVRFDYGERELFLQHELAQEPLDGTLVLNVVSGDPECVNGVSVNGRTLQFQCNGEELEEINVSYQYVAERFSEFPVNVPIDQDSVVTVYIDGARTFDFTVNGSTVVLPADALDIDSTVRIIVTQVY